MTKWAFILVASASAIADACPMCRDSVAKPQAAGFNSSIGILLGGMGLVVAMALKEIVRQARRDRF